MRNKRLIVRLVLVVIASSVALLADRKPGWLPSWLVEAFSDQRSHSTPRTYPLPGPHSSSGGSNDNPSTPGGGEAGPSTTAGRYEKYEGCRLIDHPRNDGDSFRVQFPGGRIEEMRLYFVDCPESAFRTYGGGATNRERIGQQAEYFGITPEQAVEIGVKAKHLTLERLGRQPFTVYTCWEDPFHDHRYHAIIEMGRGDWLHRELVKEGYSRIFTKPSEMPDGTPAKAEVATLRSMESEAKSSRRGAWGLTQ